MSKPNRNNKNSNRTYKRKANKNRLIAMLYLLIAISLVFGSLAFVIR